MLFLHSRKTPGRTVKKCSFHVDYFPALQHFRNVENQREFLLLCKLDKAMVNEASTSSAKTSFTRLLKNSTCGFCLIGLFLSRSILQNVNVTN
jgi:hypothetical protein